MAETTDEKLERPRRPTRSDRDQAAVVHRGIANNNTLAREDRDRPMRAQYIGNDSFNGPIGGQLGQVWYQ